jgi:hypothetical protein
MKGTKGRGRTRRRGTEREIKGRKEGRGDEGKGKDRKGMQWK